MSARSPCLRYSISLGMWKRYKLLSIASVTSKKDSGDRMVKRDAIELGPGHLCRDFHCLSDKQKAYFAADVTKTCEYKIRCREC
jgi:hypothetical protein